MVQFPGCRSTVLCIHTAVTGSPTGRVTPFGYLRITRCLLLPAAFRSLPRPSSPDSSKASSVDPFSLDHISHCPFPVSSRHVASLARHQKRKNLMSKITLPAPALTTTAAILSRLTPEVPAKHRTRTGLSRYNVPVSQAGLQTRRSSCFNTTLIGNPPVEYNKVCQAWEVFFRDFFNIHPVIRLPGSLLNFLPPEH